ncbi:hypothetical protein DSM104329_02032 [Capillimicrobium parvum]|uniref:Uncharacterized protein n=2 Tax=Capillimicrobium parvum TaxID=2884022 RepID=A0A9E7C0K8_9ACTN|nr:hypothetical protein DSM104329_02032 [Capillimicrobium parvum]
MLTMLFVPIAGAVALGIGVSRIVTDGSGGDAATVAILVTLGAPALFGLAWSYVYGEKRTDD